MVNCGNTKARVKLKNSLIKDKIIDKYNNVLPAAKDVNKVINKYSDMLGEAFNMRESLAVLTNNGTKISFKEDLLKLIDAKNDIFYPENTHLRNESPFETTFLGRTANGPTIEQEFIDNETGYYYIYSGEVYIHLEFTPYKGEAYSLAYNPHTEKKYYKIPEQEVFLKNRRAIEVKHEGKYYMLTPSNQAINMTTHRVIDSDSLNQILRNNIIALDSLYLYNDDVISQLHDYTSKVTPYEEFKKLAINHVDRRKAEGVDNAKIRQELKCM
jgi:hypothetical protein